TNPETKNPIRTRNRAPAEHVHISGLRAPFQARQNSPHGRLGRSHPNPRRTAPGSPRPAALGCLSRRTKGSELTCTVYAPPHPGAIPAIPRSLLRAAPSLAVIEFAKIMRIFILGAGATGSLLAQLLERQGHDVWCGDRDPARARRFLGKKSPIAVTFVNARNLRGILRAALRLRAHYVDLSSHLTRNPFKPEQFRYARKFEAKRRAALINAGAAPGLTNLLVKRAAELLSEVQSVQIRLYESSESDDPISQWSPE